VNAFEQRSPKYRGNRFFDDPELGDDASFALEHLLLEGERFFPPAPHAKHLNWPVEVSTFRELGLSPP